MPHLALAKGGSTDDSRAAAAAWPLRALLIVLSVTAGSADTIGFLDLNGLFVAHITGNLVLLAAHVVQGGDAQISKIFAVPAFIVALDVTIALAGWMKAVRIDPLAPLLLLHFLLLVSFAILCVVAGPFLKTEAAIGVAAAMAGVSAMAAQNSIVQVALEGATSTAVMTTNIVRLATDLGVILLGHDGSDVEAARARATRTLPVIIGFAVGCILGAATEMAIGVRSLALPACLALVALAIGLVMRGHTTTSNELPRKT